MTDIIRSRQNALVKRVRELIDSKRARYASGLCVADGIHLLQLQLSTGGLPQHILIAARHAQDQEMLDLRAALPNSLWAVLADDIFDQIAPTESPSGVLALVPLPVPKKVEPSNALDTLVLDRVQDPGNVGSLVRTAVASGIKQVILSAGCADVWSPRCLRAGQGAQWLAQVYTDVPLDEFLQDYQGAIAATLLDGGQDLYRHSLLAPTAWLFGNEGQGLAPSLAQRATHRITIPMPGGMESLNVNAAAAVCLFEQVRQRSTG